MDNRESIESQMAATIMAALIIGGSKANSMIDRHTEEYKARGNKYDLKKILASLSYELVCDLTDWTQVPFSEDV